LRSADGTLAEVPRKVRSNMIGRMSHPVGLAGCQGASDPTDYISDESRSRILICRNPLHLRSMPTLSSTRTETPHGAAAGKTENAALEAPEGRGARDAASDRRDADKTEGKDRDLVHGDGGTLGLGRPKDLNHDD
jgi:hypothetical protein